jgi:hypothetical protein
VKKKHIGASVFEDVKQWEKDAAFKLAVKEHVEKAKLAQMLKEVRGKEKYS